MKINPWIAVGSAWVLVCMAFVFIFFKKPSLSLNAIKENKFQSKPKAPIFASKNDKVTLKNEEVLKLSISNPEPKPLFDANELEKMHFESVLAMLAKSFLPNESQDWAAHFARADTLLGNEPVVITRSQFRDVVMKQMPTALPTGSLQESVLGIDFDSLEMDKELLKDNLNDIRIVWDSVCSPSQIQPQKNWKRVSFVLKRNSNSVQCALDRYRSWQTKKIQPTELSLVFLDDVRGPFLGFVSEENRAFHVQSWKPTWIEKVTANWDNNPNAPISKLRATRFAQLVRPLVYMSDVRLRYEGSNFKTFGHLLLDSKENLPLGVWAEKNRSLKNSNGAPLFLNTRRGQTTFVIGLQGKNLSLLK